MKKIFDGKAFDGWNISLPLIQGGMGVGVSLGGLAGAVAKEGGVGITPLRRSALTNRNLSGMRRTVICGGSENRSRVRRRSPEAAVWSVSTSWSRCSNTGSM